MLRAALRGSAQIYDSTGERQRDTQKERERERQTERERESEERERERWMDEGLCNGTLLVP